MKHAEQGRADVLRHEYVSAIVHLDRQRAREALKSAKRPGDAPDGEQGQHNRQLGKRLVERSRLCAERRDQRAQPVHARERG